MEEVCFLPSGAMLYREPNEAGGHRYWSDSVGGGVMIWDTCLVGEEELLAAMLEEHRRRRAEQEARRKS